MATPVARTSAMGARGAVLIVVYEDFEWDDLKASINLRKHGVSFEEAVTALADPRAIEAPDLVYSDRFVTIGRSLLLRVLFVVHTQLTQDGRVRLISARKASASQRRQYEES